MKCASCNNEIVFLPFQRQLRRRDSTFTLDVPNRDHLQSWFHKLDLVPAYFSQQAHRLGLDADPAREVPIAYPLSFTVRHKTGKELALKQYELTSAALHKVEDIFAGINTHFEAEKPAFYTRCPVFLDWVIVGDDGREIVDDMSAYVAERLDQFYGEPVKAYYYNALPLSVRENPYGNNFHLPDNFWETPNLRMRLHLAPNTGIVFHGGADDVLNALGFDASVLFDARGRNVYSLTNERTQKEMVIVAQYQPHVECRPSRKFWLDAHVLNIDSPNATMLVTPAMEDSPHLMAEEVNRCLKWLAAKTNFRLKLAYSPGEHKYLFSFPSQSKMAVSVMLPKEAATALGYEEAIVTKASKPSQVPEKEDHNLHLTKARALTFDTGQILCCQKDVSSLTLLGASQGLMAYLRPTDSGRLELAQLPFCRPVIRVAGQQASELPGRASVTFQLVYVDEDERVKPLTWPCDAFVQGLLVCYQCKCDGRGL